MGGQEDGNMDNRVCQIIQLGGILFWSAFFVGWYFLLKRGFFAFVYQEDPIEDALHRLVNTVRHAHNINPNLDVEVFVHKVQCTQKGISVGNGRLLQCSRSVSFENWRSVGGLF